jgi:hypothetical protein
MTEFLSLFIAHLLADFYWQPDHWVQDKRANHYRSKYLYFHGGVVTITSYVLLAYWSNPLPALLIGVMHGLIDVLKLTFDKKGGALWFIVDQGMHLISIVVTALVLTHYVSPGITVLADWLRDTKNIAVVAGALLCLSPISYLVGILTRPWRDELSQLSPDADDNLANAGRWIGMSERLLIFVFVLMSQFSAIGFLIAAKSLLRYNDKGTGGEVPPAYISKKSEYVLVGTLMSYTASVGVALAVRAFF